MVLGCHLISPRDPRETHGAPGAPSRRCMPMWTPAAESWSRQGLWRWSTEPISRRCSHGSRSVFKSPAGWCPMIEGFEHCSNVPWLLAIFLCGFCHGNGNTIFCGFRQTNSWPPINFTGGSHAPHRWEVDEVGCALRSCQCWGEAEHSEGDQGMEQWRMLHGVRWLRDGFRVWI